MTYRCFGTESLYDAVVIGIAHDGSYYRIRITLPGILEPVEYDFIRAERLSPR